MNLKLQHITFSAMVANSLNALSLFSSSSGTGNSKVVVFFFSPYNVATFVHEHNQFFSSTRSNLTLDGVRHNVMDLKTLRVCVCSLETESKMHNATIEQIHNYRMCFINSLVAVAS